MVDFDFMGTLIGVRAKLCWTVALQEQVWTPLV